MTQLAVLITEDKPSIEFQPIGPPPSEDDSEDFIIIGAILSMVGGSFVVGYYWGKNGRQRL